MQAGSELSGGLGLIGFIRQEFDHCKIHYEEGSSQHESADKSHGVVYRTPIRTLKTENQEQRAKTRTDGK